MRGTRKEQFVRSIVKQPVSARRANSRRFARACTRNFNATRDGTRLYRGCGLMSSSLGGCARRRSRERATSSDRYSQLTVEHIILPACISRAAARFFRERKRKMRRVRARREERAERREAREKLTGFGGYRARTRSLYLKQRTGILFAGIYFRSLVRRLPQLLAKRSEARRGEARSETTRAHKASPPRKLHSRFFIFVSASTISYNSLLYIAEHRQLSFITSRSNATSCFISFSFLILEMKAHENNNNDNNDNKVN